MAPKPKFNDGEKVLCFHGPLLYEAKCLKFQVKDKLVRYFIHYSGWNKNWDEWVPESRVLKYNDVNMQKQRDLAAINNKEKKKKAVKGSTKKEPTDRESTVLPPQEKTPKQKNKEAAATAASTAVETPAADPQKKKRTPRAELNVETEEEHMQKLEVKIKIMDELKHYIVDDWNYINNQNKLVRLPARIPIETLLIDFKKQKAQLKNMTPNNKTAIDEIIGGITEYFNAMLGSQLLYDFERSQYTKLIAENPDAAPSQLYGVYHLLRLITLLGSKLAYTPLSENSINLINSNIAELLKYIAKSASTIFSNSDYIDASEDKLKHTAKRSTSVNVNDDGPEEKKPKVKSEA